MCMYVSIYTHTYIHTRVCVYEHVFFFLSALIGLLYPCIDRRLGEPHKLKREWSSVMRCVAVFVGINHASAVSFSHHNALFFTYKTQN